MYSILFSEIQAQMNRVGLNELRERVKANMDQDQLKQKKRFDVQRAKARKYKVGELVMVQKTNFPTTGQSKELTEIYGTV